MDGPIKKKRTENWSSGDKALLRSLAFENAPIIENKNCDTNTNKSKKECWENILALFNAASETNREVAQIQFQWRGMKLKAKKAESAYRKETKATGGGPPPKPPVQEYADIIDLLPNEFIRDSNKFDSDGPEQKFQNQSLYEVETEPFQEDEAGTEKVDENIDYKIREKNDFLSTDPKKRKRKFKNNNNDADKTKVYQLAMVFMTKEHEKRMEILGLEKQCRSRELKKIDLEIGLME